MHNSALNAPLHGCSASGNDNGSGCVSAFPVVEFLDFFDFHSVINREEGVSAQNASLMSRFLDMLENGDYRHNREVMFVQISDMFRFSSPAYFSRYVQRMLGVNPTRYRE